MWADRYNNVLEGARRGRPPNDRPADVLDAIYSSVACEREGTRERCTRSVLVLRLRGRPHASMLCHLPDGPSLRGGLGGWPRDLPAPHLLYLAWKKRQSTAAGTSHVYNWPEWLSKSPYVRRRVMKIWRALLRMQRASLALRDFGDTRKGRSHSSPGSASGELKLPAKELAAHCHPN